MPKGQPPKLNSEQHTTLKEYATGKILVNGRRATYREIAAIFSLSGPSAVYWYVWRPIATAAASHTGANNVEVPQA